MRGDDAELLIRTGPGTPMGDLFRRYWLPALKADELAAPGGPPVRVTLLGERLLAFRDSDGRLGLIDEFCAHRGVSLWFGRNEAGGLRCAYHGWRYDVTGQCTEIPSEPAENGFCRKIKLRAYPCREVGDVIWTYMGPPELMPAPPAFEWAHVSPPQRFVSKRVQETNWLQALEGDIDSSHSAFLHGSSLNSDSLFAGAPGNDYGASDRRPVFEVQDFAGGLLIGARRNAEPGRHYWRITPWIVPAFTVVPPRGAHPFAAHAWVPIDDESCWTWCINFHPHRDLSGDERRAMERGQGIHARLIPGTFTPMANRRNDYLIDRAAQKAGRTSCGVEGVGMQDTAVQESMGSIQDRTREHLVSSDNGILMMRRHLFRLVKAGAAADVPGLTPDAQRVRSCETLLPADVGFVDGAREDLFGGIAGELQAGRITL